jgi:hypothetical protein
MDTRQPTASQIAASEYAIDSGEYACGQERATQIWLNLPEVQKALHVKLVGKSSFGFSTGLNYTFTTGSLLDEYKTQLIPNLRILQYSGVLYRADVLLAHSTGRTLHAQAHLSSAQQSVYSQRNDSQE